MTIPRRRRPAAKAKTLSASSSIAAPTSGERALQRDLEVHREELATQNEELRRANAVLMITTERYAQLYDGAPMAYFTLDEGGTVIEANLAGSALLEAVSTLYRWQRRRPNA